MKTHKISEQQFILDCINKEFSIINSELHFDTFEQLTNWAKENENWFSKHSFETEEQYNEWKEYYLTHFYDWQPKYISKITANREFSWFDLNYGFTNDWYSSQN